MKVEEIIEKLESLGNPVNVAGMKRFGITAKKAFGVSMPVLKELAKDVKKRRKIGTNWLWNFGKPNFTKRGSLLI